MVAASSTPFLSVAADAIRDLEGPDATLDLWTIFTKCKEALPNGARLENITWRLWHRELRGHGRVKNAQTTKECEPVGATGLEKSSYRPPTPSAVPRIASDTVLPFSEVRSPPSYSLSPPTRSLSENDSRPSSKTSSSGTSHPVGRIICNFLLNSNMEQPPLAMRMIDGSSASAATQSNFETALIAGKSLASCLPTPDTEVSELGSLITLTGPKSPSPSSNATTSGLHTEPPKLVVVNPTPNLTPQPTPPATPLVTGRSSAMQGTRSHWLAPPPTRNLVSQSRYEEEAAVGIKDAARAIPSLGNILQSDRAIVSSNLVARDGQGPTDGRSASSVASEWSYTTSHTTSSVAGASTTSASSGYLDGEKASNLIDTTKVYTHPVGNLPLATLHGLGSLSTLQSISTDRGRKEATAATASSDIGDAVRDSPGMVVAEESAEQQMTTKGKPSLGSRATSASKKRAKRKSALVSLNTDLACPTTSHVVQPHDSPAVPLSTELPTNPELTSPTDFNSAMIPEGSKDRSSSHSHSQDGSSMNGSRSRSRERTGNPFAVLSGIGTLGGYTIAAAYPPPNMMVRKNVVVGANKGKVKAAMGRGYNGRLKAARRNSAGSTLDAGAKEKDKGASAKLERVNSVEHQQSLGDILEKSILEQQPADLPQVHALLHEEKALQNSTSSTAAAKQHNLPTTDAVPKPYAELLTTGEPIQGFKCHSRFNIGSNSDDGSGMGSKSAGSGSSHSGGHSLGQRAGKMMKDNQGDKEARLHAVNEGSDVLLLEEQERERRMEASKEEVQPLEMQQHKPQNARAVPLKPLPAHKSTRQEIRHSKATHHAHKMPHSGLEGVQSSSRGSEKAKGRAKTADHHDHAVPAPTSKSSKTKSRSTPNLGSLDPVLAAKVRDSLGEPLLPKGRTVVVDSESEYTDTEDGSWSDEEVIDETEAQKQEQIRQDLVLEQEREKREADRQKQELLHQKHLQQQQQHRHPQQHTGIQRTHSSHYPAPNNPRATKGVAQRNRQQQIRELALHHAKLEQAAKEAQRQRDMIKKLPRESFQDLAKSRANSVGLLTQLLNPKPEVLPENHPSRRGYSSSSIQPMALAPMPPMHPTTSDPGPSANLDTPEKVSAPQQSIPAAQVEAIRPPPRRHMSTDERRRRISSLSKITSPIRGPPLQFTKTFAAVPVSSQVQVASVSTKAPPSSAVTSGVLGDNLPLTGSGGYRSKGPPKDQEMEDSDSETETGKILMSKSIAEQKLKALAEKRGIRQHRPIAQPQPQAGPSKVVAGLGDEDVPDWARVSQPERQQERQPLPISRPPPSAPIPLGHPYNLPPPAPPTTPRTTRRQMLATELSESLRRGLLWERQVTKSNLAAVRRSSSSGVNRHNGPSRLQPFTSIAPVVQLHAKGTIPLDQQEDPAARTVVPMTEAEREEMRRHAIARNRSWANEFHFAGW